MTYDLQLIEITPEKVGLIAPLFDAYRQFYGQPPDHPPTTMADSAKAYLRKRASSLSQSKVAVNEDRLVTAGV